MIDRLTVFIVNRANNCLIAADRCGGRLHLFEGIYGNMNLFSALGYVIGSLPCVRIISLYYIAVPILGFFRCRIPIMGEYSPFRIFLIVISAVYCMFRCHQNFRSDDNISINDFCSGCICSYRIQIISGLIIQCYNSLFTTDLCCNTLYRCLAG